MRFKLITFLGGTCFVTLMLYQFFPLQTEDKKKPNPTEILDNNSRKEVNLTPISEEIYNQEFYKDPKIQYKLFKQLEKNLDQIIEEANSILKISEKNPSSIQKKSIQKEVSIIAKESCLIKKMKFNFQNSSTTNDSNQKAISPSYQGQIKWEFLALYLELELFYDSIYIYILQKNNKIYPPITHMQIVNYKKNRLKKLLSSFYESIT